MELASLGRTPIPGPAPAGRDARYDPEYTELQAEIDKLSSLTQSEEVQWSKVVELAAGILALKAKDLLAAVYLAVGLQENRGFEGLQIGTEVLRDLVANHWEDGFPTKKRLRGRINAFSWWQEKTLERLKGRMNDPPIPAESRDRLIAEVKELDQLLAELLPDLTPMRELLNQLQRLPVIAADEPATATPAAGSEPTPATRPQPDPTEAPSNQASGQATPPSPPEDAAAAGKALAAAALAFAGLGRGENPSDPWPWKASRLAAWLKLKALPPAGGGQTMIPAPDQAVKRAILTQLEAGKLLEAAQAAEEHFTGAIFWLDLQRIIARALGSLGADYQLAHEAVCTETRLLLKRLSGLEQLCFADGTPFADPETKAWLTSLSTEVEPSSSRPADDGQPQANAAGVLHQATELFTHKQEAKALDLVSRAIEQSPDGPARMRLRLGQMNLLCRGGRYAMAAALAEAVCREIDDRGLETWDPALTLESLLAAHQALTGLGGEHNLTKARAIAARISRIRPAAALNLAL